MDSCLLCKEQGGALVWSGLDCRIVLINDAELPGFCRVIWHEHVTEMSALNHAQRNLLMRIVVGVEEVIASAMKPLKINLASGATNSLLGSATPLSIIPPYYSST